MRRSSLVGCGAAAVGIALLAGPASAAPLDFDRTFGARGSQALHLAADYRAGGQPHHVEVWRDGDARIKRTTDDAVETQVVRPAGAVEWSMVVLDRKRKIRTDIDRTNLMRIGHYTDWFSQAHALNRPRGDYRLVALDRGAKEGVTPVAPCRWYRLTERERTSDICWSATAAVPLVIVAGDVVQWQVTKLATAPLAPSTFVVDDRGYVRNDANADIQAD